MERWQQTKGYPPNSWLTMVRRPAVFRAYRALHTAVMMDEGEVPKALKFTLATRIEERAAAFAQKHLAPWQPVEHMQHQTGCYPSALARND